MDPEELLTAARKRSLGEDEVRDLASQLSTTYSPTITVILKALSHGGLPKHAPLIDRYLSSRNPYIIADVLATLCDAWKLCGEYKPYVLRFMKGVEWDPLDQLWIKVISVAGDCFRETGDRDFLTALVSLVNSHWAEEEHLAEHIRESVARAMGLSWPEILSELDEKRWKEVLRQAEEVLSEAQ